MEKKFLSLKNIYRFLFIRDYPIYSTGIIREGKPRNVTLLKFWPDMLTDHFRNQKYGKMIWRSYGSRNRYLSEICNRSIHLKLYTEYMYEIINSATVEVINEQIQCFMDFLINHQFSYDIFLKKLWVLLKQFETEDPCYDAGVRDFFLENKELVEKFRIYGIQGQAFYCSWYLVFLMIHAMVGECMETEEFLQWRSNTELCMESLWKSRMMEQQMAPEVRFLTAQTSEVCGKALPGFHFFGREEELLDLREMVKKGGHYLLSGIGGVGKTELLRQLLECCFREKLVDAICTVQYEGSLAESFVRAFLQVSGDSLEENFREALSRIRSYHNKRVLILIDNVNRTMEEDKDLAELLQLSATVIMTSRIVEIPGFQTYKVKVPTRETSLLIFRDNFGEILSEKEREALETLLNRPIWRHTLTLRFLGQAAKNNNWNVRKLKDQLEESTVVQKENESAIEEKLQELYRRVYQQEKMCTGQKRFLCLFAALPYRNYTSEFIERYLFLEFKEKAAFKKEIHSLKQHGWLEERENGFAMHPFIAECLLNEGVWESDVEVFFRNVEQQWETEGVLFGEQDRYAFINSVEADRIILSELILSVSGRIKGKLSAATMRLVLLAAEVIKHTYDLSQKTYQQLERMMTQCEEVTEEMRIYYYVLSGNTCNVKLPIWEEVYRAQEENRSIPRYLYWELKHLLIENYILAGKFEEAQRLLQEGMGEEMTLRQYLIHCYDLGQIAGAKGNMTEYLEWNTRGIDAAAESGENVSDLLFSLLGAQCGACISLWKLEEARQCVEQMEEIVAEGNSTQREWYLSFYKGSLELHEGNLEAAVESLRRAKELAGYLFGTNHFNYVMQCEELAVVLQNQGSFEEAEENHMPALRFIEGKKEHQFEYNRILHNLGVLYRKWGRQKEAYEYSLKAYQIGRNLGKIQMAEPAYNLSKICREEGNTAGELQYLKQAYPVFEETYGPQNPKVMEARERLAELGEI